MDTSPKVQEQCVATAGVWQGRRQSFAATLDAQIADEGHLWVSVSTSGGISASPADAGDPVTCTERDF